MRWFLLVVGLFVAFGATSSSLFTVDRTEFVYLFELAPAPVAEA